jgi:predicted NAD/FAD-binding protein
MEELDELKQRRGSRNALLAYELEAAPLHRDQIAPQKTRAPASWRLSLWWKIFAATTRSFAADVTLCPHPYG